MVVFGVFVKVASLLLFAFIGVLSLRDSEGNNAYRDAMELVKRHVFDEASISFWKSVITHSEEDSFTVIFYHARYLTNSREKLLCSHHHLTVCIFIFFDQLEEALTGFLQCFSIRGILDEGYYFIGDEYAKRKDLQSGLGFYAKALEVYLSYRFLKTAAGCSIKSYW